MFSLKKMFQLKKKGELVSLSVYCSILPTGVLEISRGKGGGSKERWKNDEISKKSNVWNLVSLG